MSQPPILSYENLALQQGDGWLFQDIDLHVGPKDRLALIGRNGAGKTTLLRLIADDIEADRGKRTIQPGVNIVMLEQEPDFSQSKNLLDWAISGHNPPAQHEVEAIADQLGIDLSRPCSSASGGEKRRAAIARALAQAPDLLLLDEPTNHLDIAAIDWLEQWLNRYHGAFIVISHDRTFLKRLTKQTIWLDRKNLRRNEIGFGGYEAWEEQVYAEEARAAEKMDAKLKIEAHWLERGVTARRKRNQGRLQKLHEMRAQRAAMISPQGTAKMKLVSDDVKTKSVIVAENISKSFTNPESGEERKIINGFTLRVQRGDRIGIVGANGAGKTTLVKMLTGEMQPDSGTITRAKTLDGVVIDQQRKLLSPEKRVRDILAEGGDWVDVRGTRKHVQGYLKEFLFDPGLIDARIGTFSGGERSRLLLAREFARASNLLVLDEPTNDLDLETLDLLQEVVADYDGTVIIVSHDRDFLDRTVTVTLGMDGTGHIDIIAGGYDDWEKKRKSKKSTKPNKSALSKQPQKQKSDNDNTNSPQVATKLSYKDQRDFDTLPENIEKLEKMIERGMDMLSDPNLYQNNPVKFAEITKAIEKAREEKDNAELRWLELAERVEQIEGS